MVTWEPNSKFVWDLLFNVNGSLTGESLHEFCATYRCKRIHVRGIDNILFECSDEDFLVINIMCPEAVGKVYVVD